MKKQPSISFLTRALMPLILWLLLWLWWGDVLWATAEHSYYGQGGQQMHFLWQQPYGSLWIMGRLLLTTAHQPALGAALLALLLTACAALLRYTFRLRRGQEWMPVSAFMLWMVHQGLNLFWQSEPGRLFGIPVLALALLSLESFFLWTFRHRHHSQSASYRQACTQNPPGLHTPPRRLHTLRRRLYTFAASAGLYTASLLAPVIYAHAAHPHTRPICHMQRAMEQDDWHEMLATARRHAAHTTRPLAAYHAIALVHTDQVLTHAFDLQYLYRDLSLRDRAGQPDRTNTFFIVDCNLHAGLLQASYHKAIEALTMEGPTVHLLKRLCQVAVMRGETKLADKYLTLLRQEPFADSFITKWTHYNTHPAALEADPAVAAIRRLEPLHDSMEGNYAPPVFLGYNIALTEGRSPQALENSIAVCLYTKLMPAFLERTRYMQPERLATRTVALDALAMQASKVPGITEAVPAVQYRTGRCATFLQAVKAAGATGDTEARKPYAEQILCQWPAYYPAYYFYGNLDATVQGAARHYGYDNAGVN